MSDRYAYVYVVWGNPSYLVGAAVSAASLRHAGARADIVLMMHGIDQIDGKTPFDTVLQIPEVWSFQCRQQRTPRQEQFYGGKFSSTVMTKWQCLGLKEYTKVLFVDSDVLWQRNPDELFQLQAPAGVFSNPWIRNRAYPDLSHRARITPRQILDALAHNGTGPMGGLILLEPGNPAADVFAEWCREQQPLDPRSSFSGVDEYYIARWYATRDISWTNIHQRFHFVPWKREWWPESPSPTREATGLHYIHDKPWEAGEGAGWADTRIWFRAWDRTCREYPEVQRALERYVEKTK